MNIEKIERLAKEIRIRPGIFDDSRIITDAANALERTASARALAARLSLWRTIMRNPITKLAAAAVVVLAAALSLKIISITTTPVYAFEQTIQANHSVRYLHMKRYDAQHSDEPAECWLECDESGRIKNFKNYSPDWGSGNGTKVAVWSEGKVQVWNKGRNLLLITRDEKIADDIFKKLVQEYDPRLAVERLYEQEKQNKVKLDINEPSDKTQDIKVTADFAAEGSSPGKRLILFVDQATKLVTAIEEFLLKDGNYQYNYTTEFLDYNQPIDPAMFNLDKEVPADVTVLDQVKDIGLVQGKLSNDEVAVEVVRHFFEALIAKDYAKAGNFYESIPAGEMKKAFGRIRFIRIISIGKPIPHPIPETKGVVVSCTVEVEENGKIREMKFDQIGVRQVYTQPGRWTIFGGI
jgi:hypothetical protein